MSASPRSTPEPGGGQRSVEERLRRAASAFPYPATPDLAARARRSARRVSARKPKRLALGLALVFILMAAALLVSPARARVLDWIRIGAVRIFFTQPTATATFAPQPSGTPSPVSRLTPTPTFLRSVLDIGGETTLAEARERAGFPIQAPLELGSPAHVFYQELDGPVVVLVWMDADQPGKVRMSLTESNAARVIFQKYAPKSVLDTRVGDHPAVWVDGEYLLVVRSGDVTLTRMIDQGHTLIWTDGVMTYRLETDVDLETAIQLAQSMAPLP